ncbi:unnamed protein product [Phytomonas sp. Hart1]|nr:unnamed protein product [Phytomonas sp. Hart1]|eukprot:CCW67478.1 unnamed protein product [Phytomonas sp. isolate Hart1]
MVLLRLRIAVIGASTSGKTAFVQMLHSNGTTFPKKYLMTMGCDFVIKEIKVKENDSVEVTMLDVAGQGLYEQMVPTYLECANAFILMYDITNRSTFEECEKWVKKLRNVRCDLPLLLVANKTDLMDKSEVSDAHAQSFAGANKMKYFKCSALRATGIEEPVEALARQFLENYENRLELLSQIS